MRSPSALLDDIPGDLPNGAIPEGCVLDDLANWAVKGYNELREESLTDDVIWRDLFALTTTFRTIVGRSTVFRHLSERRKLSQAGECVRTSAPARLVSVLDKCSWVDIDVEFPLCLKNSSAVGKASLSVTWNPHGERKIWLVRTWLDHFVGHGHPDKLSVKGTVADRGNLRDSVMETQSNGHSSCNRTYHVVIVGGGQAGLSVAGRLQALGIDYIILEKFDSLGDIWRTRYSSLRWHTPKEYGNLPFGRMFADGIPELVPTAAIGDAHDAWAKQYNIRCQTNCHVDTASFDGDSWTIRTIVKGKQQTFHSKDLVLAIGPGSTNPSIPSWATPDQVKQSGFLGTVMHAKDYKSCQSWIGKHARGVTVGTANTGHDIAEDMATAGMTTTMLQRGHTFVIPGEWLCAAEGAHYNATTSNTEADEQQFTMPLKVMRQIINANVHAGIRAHPERFDKLEQAGFKLDRFGDLYSNIFTRFGGHYVDTGASARIAAGEIKMESTAARRLVRNGIELEDGRILECDLTVLATGYLHDFRKDAARIIGEETAGQMDDYFGLDCEGEIRGYAKYAGFPHLYYHGGDTRASRFKSRFVALQIQADLLENKDNDHVKNRVASESGWVKE